jgi:probable addiction module antidote protein
MPRRSQSYSDYLQERLKDPEEAAAYLNAVLDTQDEPDFEAVLLGALRHVAKAHGIAAIAERSQLNRESLYRALSEKGDPKLRTIAAVLHAMGLRLCVQAAAQDTDSEARASAG